MNDLAEPYKGTEKVVEKMGWEQTKKKPMSRIRVKSLMTIWRASTSTCEQHTASRRQEVEGVQQGKKPVTHMRSVY